MKKTFSKGEKKGLPRSQSYNVIQIKFIHKNMYKMNGFVVIFSWKIRNRLDGIEADHYNYENYHLSVKLRMI